MCRQLNDIDKSWLTSSNLVTQYVYCEIFFTVSLHVGTNHVEKIVYLDCLYVTFVSLFTLGAPSTLTGHIIPVSSIVLTSNRPSQLCRTFMV